MTRTCWRESLNEDGVVNLAGVFAAGETAAFSASLEHALASSAGLDASIRSQDGVIYAARNVLRIWPDATTCWRREPLSTCLAELLGPHHGLVRVLYFDKPPEQTWALPWHQDLTIAVRNNRLPSQRFTKPTRKAGVPHVEAPLEVLERMLTARIHLDAATDENGPLKVIPGSHRNGKALTLDVAPPRVLHAAAGDVLLMRPLIAHCSGKSHEATTRHRRVLHLEFAASAELGDGYAWHDFIPARQEH